MARHKNTTVSKSAVSKASEIMLEGTFTQVAEPEQTAQAEPSEVLVEGTFTQPVETARTAVAEAPASKAATPVKEAKRTFLRAAKYDVVDPTSGVRLSTRHVTEVHSISPWLRSQIRIGLVEYA